MVAFHHVLLLPTCLTIISKESKTARGVETGGPMVGYVSKKGLLIVTDAAGPGPRARLEPFTVTIDGAHAQKFCDRARSESNGRIDYVGDWHKHTEISLQPSNQDALAMKTMADFAFCPTKHPVSLIYRTWPRAWRVYCWDGSGKLIQIPSARARNPTIVGPEEIM